MNQTNSCLIRICTIFSILVFIAIVVTLPLFFATDLPRQYPLAFQCYIYSVAGCVIVAVLFVTYYLIRLFCWCCPRDEEEEGGGREEEEEEVAVQPSPHPAGDLAVALARNEAVILSPNGQPREQIEGAPVV
jgi:hypothetical protein